jgi:protein-S-isoprenylcysteine O-methyltransferase Ste14
VRIQREIGHRVVDAGPYRRIRHPGYLGLALWALGTPFALGSRWALLPAGVTAGYIALRTALEDRFLQRDLEGYSQYAGRVRYRLLPGIW